MDVRPTQGDVEHDHILLSLCNGQCQVGSHGGLSIPDIRAADEDLLQGSVALWYVDIGPQGAEGVGDRAAQVVRVMKSVFRILSISLIKNMSNNRHGRDTRHTVG